MMTCAVPPGLKTVATFVSIFRKAAGVRKGGTARIFVHLMEGLPRGSFTNTIVAVEKPWIVLIWGNFVVEL